MQQIYGIIYKYESPSGKIYIGQTKYTIEKRRAQHLHCVKRGSHLRFYNAIRKYGMDAMKEEILQDAYSKEELNELEIQYIEKFQSFSSRGYNMTKGGEGATGYIFSEKDRKKLSASLKDFFRKNPEIIPKMSDRAKEYNKNHPEKGENHSKFMKVYANLPETKTRTTNALNKYRAEHPEAVSVTLKEIWKRDGYREKMSNKQKEYNKTHVN